MNSQNLNTPKIHKWVPLRTTVCNCCNHKCVTVAFVHATDDDNKMSDDLIDDYFCSHSRCACKGTLMGHYTKYCSRCRKSTEVDDDEVDDL